MTSLLNGYPFGITEYSNETAGRDPTKPFYATFYIDNTDGTFTVDIVDDCTTEEEVVERLKEERDDNDPCQCVVFRCEPVMQLVRPKFRIVKMGKKK